LIPKQGIGESLRKAVLQHLNRLRVLAGLSERAGEVKQRYRRIRSALQRLIECGDGVARITRVQPCFAEFDIELGTRGLLLSDLSGELR